MDSLTVGAAEEAAPVLRLFVIRGALLGLGFLASIAFSWLVIADFGAGTYGAVALVAAIPLLIPFADFGLGAPVVAASADASATRDRSVLVATLAPVTRILAVVACALIGIAITFGALDIWPVLLGVETIGSATVSAAATAVVIVFAATLLPSVGTRVLQGVGRVDLATTINSGVPLIALGIALVVHLTTPTAMMYVLCAPIGALVANLVGAGLAWWELNRGLAAADSGSRLPRAHTGRLLEWGLYSAGILAAVAIMTQGARLVISHRSVAQELAVFALAWTVFSGANALVAVYGAYLWPRFRQMSTRGEFQLGTLLAEYRRALGVASVASALFVLGVVVVFEFVLGARPTFALIAGGTIAVFIQAIHQPAAMTLMDRVGMRYQLAVMVPTVVLALAVTVTLVPRGGAAAGFIGMGAAVALLQAPATFAIARRRLRRVRTPAENRD